jgi:putative membrane protein
LGCLAGLVLSAALLIPFLAVMSPAYELIQPHMHWLLIFVILVMIILERSLAKAVWAVGIFLMSGLLGLLTLDTNFMVGDAALMPLLSGLFGVSVLLPSIASGGTLPEQQVDDEPIEMRSKVKSICAGTAAGAITGIIPSVGPSQGTVMALLVTGSRGTDEFLVAVSGVNTSRALFSFVALYAIGRARSGAAVAVEKIMEIGETNLATLVGVALLAGGIAAILHLRFGKLYARCMDRVPYRTICSAVLIFIVALTVQLSGLAGALVLATATAIGILAAATKVKRTHVMGVIMLPCILYFAGVKGSLISSLGLG